LAATGSNLIEDFQMSPGSNPINKISEYIYPTLKFKHSHWLKLVM